MSLFPANFASFWRLRWVRVTLLVSLALFGVRVWFSFDPTLPVAFGFLVLFILVIFWLVLFVSILLTIYPFDWPNFLTRTTSLALTLLLFHECPGAADCVHLIVMYPHYMSVIAERTGPIDFDWGAIEFRWIPTFRTDRTLIYDVSGVSPREVGSERISPRQR